MRIILSILIYSKFNIILKYILLKLILLYNFINIFNLIIDYSNNVCYIKSATMSEVRIINNKLLHRCPVCGQEMTITKLACNHCQTKIEGEFSPCKFCRLPNDQIEFIEVFLKCRGNIKDVEKELGISYPTVRNRLDSVLQTLGYRVDKGENQLDDFRRQDILTALEKGEITAEEAAQQLRKAKK
jgi:hypothetical protein